MNEIIKRKTAEEICNHRDEALRLLGEALHLLVEAQKQANESAGKSVFWISHIMRGFWSTDDHHHSINEMTKKLDAEVWRSLFVRTGLGDHFDTKHRREFEKQLEENPLPVEIETVIATALELSSRQGDIFTESIHNLFKRLSRSHKSNDGFSFGDRIIFAGVVNSYGSWWEDTVRDLERAVLTCAGEPVPNRVNGVIALFNAEKYKLGYGPQRGTLETKHFEFRWFKNGNLHVYVKSKDIINQMNLIIADENILGENPK